MPDEASFCTRCGASFVVPQKIRSLLADTAAPRGADAERILRFCPSCRPQQFAEETIGNDLQPVPRNWPLPRRRSEERLPIRKDARTGAIVTKSQCYICNSGCDALVFEKDGRVIDPESLPGGIVSDEASIVASHHWLEPTLVRITRSRCDCWIGMDGSPGCGNRPGLRCEGSVNGFWGLPPIVRRRPKRG